MLASALSSLSALAPPRMSAVSSGQTSSRPIYRLEQRELSALLGRLDDFSDLVSLDERLADVEVSFPSAVPCVSMLLAPGFTPRRLSGQTSTKPFPCLSSLWSIVARSSPPSRAGRSRHWKQDRTRYHQRTHRRLAQAIRWTNENSPPPAAAGSSRMPCCVMCLIRWRLRSNEVVG